MTVPTTTALKSCGSRASRRRCAKCSNFTVPKGCVSAREPYSAERRKAASERAKAAGYQPPVRKSGS